MSRLPRIFAATAFLLCASASAQAQVSLLRPHPAALGASAAWAEPTSGDSGLPILQRAYQSHGRDCRTVRRHDDFKPGTERTLLLDACLVSGRWRLM